MIIVQGNACALRGGQGRVGTTRVGVALFSTPIALYSRRVDRKWVILSGTARRPADMARLVRGAEPRNA
jgi:hypothetical protein